MFCLLVSNIARFPGSVCSQVCNSKIQALQLGLINSCVTQSKFICYEILLSIILLMSLNVRKSKMVAANTKSSRISWSRPYRKKIPYPYFRDQAPMVPLMNHVIYFIMLCSTNNINVIRRIKLEDQDGCHIKLCKLTYSNF